MFLFGLPGTGKNYIGRLLETEFRYPFFDCDDVIPTGMTETLKQGNFPAKLLEDQYYQVICHEIENRSRNSKNLVVSEALLYNTYRVLLRESFPEMVFILVTCDRFIRIQRCANRSHLLTLEQCIQAEDLFEEITIPYYTLDNSQEGAERISFQISNLFRRIENRPKLTLW